MDNQPLDRVDRTRAGSDTSTGGLGERAAVSKDRPLAPTPARFTKCARVVSGSPNPVPMAGLLAAAGKAEKRVWVAVEERQA